MSVSDRISSLTPEQRALFELLRQKQQRKASGDGGNLPPIRRVSGPTAEGDWPLASAQERLWFIDQLMPGTPAYDLLSVVRIVGNLAVERLADAFIAVVARHGTLRTSFVVVARHGTLRTSFVVVGGRPVQRIASVADLTAGGWELPVIDLSALPAAVRQEEMAHRTAEESLVSFDLARGPLMRTTLLRLGTAEHVIILNVHHIVTDGFSMGVLIADLAAFAAGRALPELPVQYADYAVWQREWLTGEELERQLASWQERLAGAPTTLELPTDRPRPLDTSLRGGSVDRQVPPEVLSGLMALTQRLGTTSFMTILAAWGALLARLSGQSDLLVGTAMANRERPELERLVGLFTNTLPLRVDMKDDPQATELLARVRRTVLDAFAHRELPLERLIEALQVARDRSRPPLVQVLLTFLNAPVGGGAMEAPSGLSMTPIMVGSETAKFDLTLAAFETAGGLTTQLEYAADLFDRQTAVRWLGHYQTLLAGIVEHPESRLSELPLLSPAERQQVLVDWNRPAEPRPAPGLIHELFWQQAARTPGATALVWNEERWTYADLAARADRLAQRLRRLGVGPEVRVGVFTRRTPRMVLAVLAVLRAGGAYVPLDPAYPAERLVFLLADSGATLVLAEAELNPPAPGGGVRVIPIDSAEADDAPPAGPAVDLQPENLAYLIYTSGSTGEPKGVMIRHAAAAALVDWALGAFAAPELAGVLASTSLNFDLSVFELFVPLAAGGAVVLADDVLHLPALPAAGEVTLVNSVPSALTGMLRLSRLPSSVTTVNLAGEPLPGSLVDALWQEPGVRRVLNLYGPSEDTTYSTWSAVAAGTAKPLIGRPVDGARAYLLDRHLRPVAPGVPGEVFLGGAGLARGYLNRPDLTAERFVPDPFAPLAGEPGVRLYRTGDLARWRPDGEMEFLGRTDFQVKVRGFRIEPGEVEAVVSQHEGARACAVLVRTDPRGESRLVAYVVPAQGKELPRDLRRWLRGRLPDHMVPSVFVPLEALPVTAHGKLDRDALPEPAWGGEVEEAYVAPATPLEETMVRIAAEVLGLEVERIGVRDNFFALGGHSLLATQLIAHLRDEYQIEVSLEMVFDAADFRELADWIMERELGDAGGMLGEMGDLSPEELQELLGRPAPEGGAGG